MNFVLLNNKKAEQESLSFMWIIMFVIVSLVIAGSVSVVYSESIDTRALETSVFSEKIYDCFIDKGVLRENVFQKGFDVFEKCSLNKKVFQDESVYYFRIDFYHENGSLIKNIEENPVQEGDYSFKRDCDIEESEIEVKKGILCFSEKNSFIFYDDKINPKKGYYKLTVASNNRGESVSLG